MTKNYKPRTSSTKRNYRFSTRSWTVWKIGSILLSLPILTREPFACGPNLTLIGKWGVMIVQASEHEPLTITLGKLSEWSSTQSSRTS